MRKSLGLRMHLPDNGAVARSLLGVLGLTTAALLWGPAGAATSTAAAGAIAGAIALQDNPIGRIPIVLAVSVELGIAVFVGGLTSGFSIAFVIAIALWCFMAGMQWAVGAPAGLLAGASGLLLVIQHPQPALAALASALFAVVAGLSQAALIAVWPPRRWQRERDALTKVYRSLSADARLLAAEEAAAVDSSQLLDCKEAFSSNETPSARRSPAYRDWHALPEQIAKTLMAFRGKANGSEQIADLLAAAADMLAAIATQTRTARRDAEYALKRVDAAVTTVAVSDSAVAQRLSRQLRRADTLRFGRRHVSDWMAAFRTAFGMASRHLNPTSPISRHAARVAGAAASGTAIARFADVPAGYWIPLTVLLVMRPETAHTYTRCVGRAAGVCVGVIVASALTLIWQPTGLAAAVVAVLLLGITYAVSIFGYIAVTAAFGATIVLLLDITDPSSPVGDLLLAVVIGAALAVLFHVVIPDDALIRLRQRAGELLKTEIDYAAAVIKAFVHDLDNPSDTLAAAWQRAVRARSAFEAATGATRVESKELRLWLRSFRAALNTVTSSCTSLEHSLPPHPSTALSREFVLAVDDYVEVLRGDPPTPATPWSIDTGAMARADQQLRDAAAHIISDDGSVRVLVGEVGTITRSLAGIAGTGADARDVTTS
ncbi:FUSC family protein [Mycobacterium sp. ITM-2016-00318]|uniref:FUSC family protein n=1 Tax=Mycobacterium sp. ITM-2016-00318 TaxID=2099693 RepID=UPI00287F6A77|nr:FUSC family protein [Mycobacterium sp. ITM-2016-00318]WNG90774.1 FUSC family protein [Mycobacterium sp. ITM-2016-00318]